jgi:uncharacterized phage protein gp47/JayE
LVWLLLCLEKRSGEGEVEEEMEVSIATPPECAESVDDGKIRVAGRREEEEDASWRRGPITI